MSVGRFRLNYWGNTEVSTLSYFLGDYSLYYSETWSLETELKTYD